MRVLMTTDAVGGVWTFTQELSQGLLAAGCQVALVNVGPRPCSAQKEWAASVQRTWCKRFQFTALDAPLEWMQDNRDAFNAASPCLLRIVRAFGADVIHSSQFCFGALPVPLPVVITAHSDVLSWAAHSRREPLAESRWLRRYVEIVSRGLKEAAAVVAPTRWMMNALAMNFRLPAAQHVIYNGRMISNSTAGQRELRAVVSGRLWDEGKHIQLLADVTSPMPILVAGERVREGASEPLDIGCAQLIGRLDEADLMTLFRESAIYICTSRYEPFGLAPLEAALCGCAVLANDLPSLREVWGEAALYFQDAASLSSLLEQLTIRPDRLAELQCRSKHRASLYTRDAMTAGYLALYGEQLRTSEKARAA